MSFFFVIWKLLMIKDTISRNELKQKTLILFSLEQQINHHDFQYSVFSRVSQDTLCVLNISLL